MLLRVPVNDHRGGSERLISSRVLYCKRHDNSTPPSSTELNDERHVMEASDASEQKTKPNHIYNKLCMIMVAILTIKVGKNVSIRVTC